MDEVGDLVVTHFLDKRAADVDILAVQQFFQRCIRIADAQIGIHQHQSLADLVEQGFKHTSLLRLLLCMLAGEEDRGGMHREQVGVTRFQTEIFCHTLPAFRPVLFTPCPGKKADAEHQGEEE